MKDKKKIIIGAIIAIAIIGGGLFLLTSKVRTDVYLKDFEVQKDGKTMILKVGISNSTGYVRKMQKVSDELDHCYSFYSTFGINSKLGAKDTFEIELDENDNKIYFYDEDKSCKLVLVKNSATQKWEKINYSNNESLKLELFDKEDIVKVVINTYAQNDNYFEFSDKDIIDKIYNIFDELETEIASTTFNPEGPDEMYRIVFFNDENMLLESDNDIFKSDLDVYRKNGKYYAEQRYNGIYEITEEDFNAIKSYIK